MNPAIIIRNETDADISIITEVTVAAFKTLKISNHTEQFIIEALREAQDLTLSLVAEVDSRVVGHIAFSPVTNLGRHHELVRTRTSFCAARVPAEGYWQIPDTGRAITIERPRRQRLLFSRAPRILQKIRL